MLRRPVSVLLIVRDVDRIASRFAAIAIDVMYYLLQHHAAGAGSRRREPRAIADRLGFAAAAFMGGSSFVDFLGFASLDGSTGGSSFCLEMLWRPLRCRTTRAHSARDSRSPAISSQAPRQVSVTASALPVSETPVSLSESFALAYAAQTFLSAGSSSCCRGFLFTMTCSSSGKVSLPC